MRDLERKIESMRAIQRERGREIDRERERSSQREGEHNWKQGMEKLRENTLERNLE